MIIFRATLTKHRLFSFLGNMLALDYAQFVTVQNSQFSIHIRFANNGHIRRICTRRLIFVSIR